VVERIPLGEHFSVLASTMPDAMAISASGGKRTWRSLNARVNRVAPSLESHAVAQGDFVPIALPNSI